MALMMSETTDPWGFEWPKNPSQPAAYQVEGTLDILPAWTNPREGLVALTKEDVVLLFSKHKFDYVC